MFLFGHESVNALEKVKFEKNGGGWKKKKKIEKILEKITGGQSTKYH